MFSKVITFALYGLIFTTVAQCDNTCVPDPSGFYWKTPCDGQSFTNLIIPTNIVVYQNNVSLANLAGIDATVDLVSVIDIIDNYGKTESDPLVDLKLQKYSKIAGKCKWQNVPTAGVTSNMNTCDFCTNCRLDNPPNPTQITVTMNIAKIAGPFIGILDNATYYGIAMTFKDGKKSPISCTYTQDVLIKI